MAGLQMGLFGGARTWAEEAARRKQQEVDQARHGTGLWGPPPIASVNPMVKPRIVRSPVAGQASTLGSPQVPPADPRKRLELEAMQLQLDQARQRGAGEAAEAAIRQKMQQLTLQQQEREFARQQFTRGGPSTDQATTWGGTSGGATRPVGGESGLTEQQFSQLFGSRIASELAERELGGRRFGLEERLGGSRIASEAAERELAGKRFGFEEEMGRGEAGRRERESGSELETAALRRRLASELSGKLGGLIDETGGEGTSVAEADELQIRERLGRLLAETEQPVDVRGDPRTAQFRLAQQRAEERARTQLAGRAEAEGWGSGEIEAERRKLGEARGESEAGYEAGLVGQLGQERFARLGTALEQGRALQEGRSERALRERMARLAARTQAIGMAAPIVRL